MFDSRHAKGDTPVVESTSEALLCMAIGKLKQVKVLSLHAMYLASNKMHHLLQRMPSSATSLQSFSNFWPQSSDAEDVDSGQYLRALISIKDLITVAETSSAALNPHFSILTGLKSLELNGPAPGYDTLLDVYRTIDLLRSLRGAHETFTRLVLCGSTLSLEAASMLAFLGCVRSLAVSIDVFEPFTDSLAVALGKAVAAMPQLDTLLLDCCLGVIDPLGYGARVYLRTKHVRLRTVTSREGMYHFEARLRLTYNTPLPEKAYQPLADFLGISLYVIFHLAGCMQHVYLQMLWWKNVESPLGMVGSQYWCSGRICQPQSLVRMPGCAT